MVTQIEKDLTRHAQERLQRWVNDTRSVFDMAELGDNRAAACVITALAEALAHMMVVTDLSSEDLEHLLNHVSRRAKKRTER